MKQNGEREQVSGTVMSLALWVQALPNYTPCLIDHALRHWSYRLTFHAPYFTLYTLDPLILSRSNFQARSGPARANLDILILYV